MNRFTKNLVGAALGVALGLTVGLTFSPADAAPKKAPHTTQTLVPVIRACVDPTTRIFKLQSGINCPEGDISESWLFTAPTGISSQVK